MTGFLDLSNEIILIISSFVQPKDLDSLLLTSKHIRALNGDLITEHKNLTRQHQHTRTHMLYNLADFLKDVVLSPRISSYVETMEILSVYNEWISIRSEQSPKIDDMSIEMRESLFAKFSKSSKYVIPMEMGNPWISGIEDKREDQILGLLLPLLHNIVNLMIYEIPDWDNCLTDTIDLIAQDSKPSALTLLTRVFLSDDSCQIPLRTVHHLAILPSMQSMYVKGIKNDLPGYVDHPAISAVTNLSIRDCRVQSETMFEFLCCFESLIAFDYAGAENLDKRDSMRIHFWICKALTQNAKHSLRKLAIKSRPRGQSNPIFIGSLQSFRALEELDVDVEALLEDGVSRLSKLSTVLPRSIKKVTLRHSTDDGDGEDELMYLPEDLLSTTKKRLPLLEALNFRPYKQARVLLMPLHWIANGELAGVALSNE